MRSALDQLILAGFVCEGLSWEGYGLVGFNVVLWVSMIFLRKKQIRIGAVGEIGLLIAGSAAGFLGARLLGENTHFFIGEGITWLQAGRMLRPLDQREKAVAGVLALLQFAAACTFLLDLRFVAVLMAALVLVPKALSEIAGLARNRQLSGRRLMGEYLLIPAVMVLVFVLVPRPMVGAFFQGETAVAGTGGFGNFLDMTRSALAQSRKVLMQIEGENVGNLRLYCLVELNGNIWTMRKNNPLRPVQRETQPESLHRRVRVISPAVLGKALPVDGEVAGISGSFFRRPFQNRDGLIECDSVWNAGNNIYTYSVVRREKAEELGKRETERLTRCAISDRVKEWLSGAVSGASGPLEKTRRLEEYFQKHFKYRLGGPELDRGNPLEAFLFKEREGHCERFASALAILMRAEGIPSRVVLGFVPRHAGMLGHGYVVRFRDAHAWVEGYIPGRGWMSFDGTPSGAAETGWALSDWLNEIDLWWSMNVSTFDRAAQSALIGGLASAGAEALAEAGEHRGLGLALLAAVCVAGIYRQIRWKNKGGRSEKREVQIQYAEDLYGRMQRLLMKIGWCREPEETPWEFVERLRSGKFCGKAEVERITGLFCAARYGETPMAEEALASAEAGLRSLVSLTKECGVGKIRV